MANAYKPKHLVLQEFTKILLEHDPMSLSPPAGSEDEYEAEALSILSRFHEGALHMCEDETLQREIAVGIVKQAFEFWFNAMDIKEPEKAGWALLDAYKASYPTPEQKPATGVPSEP